MLVSTITRMNAINQMYNAQFTMLRNRQNMMCAIRNLPAFCGDMRTLAQMDQQYAIKQAHNETLYLIASMQEKSASQMIKQEAQNNKLSYIA